MEPAQEVRRLAGAPVGLLNEGEARAEILVALGDGVELTAGDDRQIVDLHAFAEAGHEAAVARDDQEGAGVRISERDGDALCLLRQANAREEELDEIAITVELERELHLGVRDAIQTREEVILMRQPDTFKTTLPLGAVERKPPQDSLLFSAPAPLRRAVCGRAGQ